MIKWKNLIPKQFKGKLKVESDDFLTSGVTYRFKKPTVVTGAMLKRLKKFTPIADHITFPKHYVPMEVDTIEVDREGHIMLCKDRSFLSEFWGAGK